MLGRHSAAVVDVHIFHGAVRIGGRLVWSGLGSFRILSLLFVDSVLLLTSSDKALHHTLDWFTGDCEADRVNSAPNGCQPETARVLASGWEPAE